MGEFFLFMLILFVFGFGAAFLVPLVRRNSTRLEPPLDNQVLARLLEDVDQLSTRLSPLEEEVDFFKELNAPEERRSISSPEDSPTGDES